MYGSWEETGYLFEMHKIATTASVLGVVTSLFEKKH